MAARSIFDTLLLIARPAAGKSEIIDYLKNTPPAERSARFHIGELVEIDDFPMLWAWLEEDMLLEQMGHPRRHTDPQGYFLAPYFWDLLIERIGLAYQKNLRDHPGYAESHTVMVEFSRGAEHGGYRSAFAHLPPEMPGRMAVLYVDVPWEESLRKNRRRFNPQKPDSILEHALPDAKLERLYKEVDWDELTQDDPHYLTIQGVRVPYVVFDNADDVTTAHGAALGERLERCLADLWGLYRV
ncbi:MAG: hypothetical protein HPY76_00205 [Anaerolineae bacterium]|jgi:hypothetical protein|nr:hypothetical protein [Anaerolineae bacterium]